MTKANAGRSGRAERAGAGQGGKQAAAKGGSFGGGSGRIALVLAVIALVLVVVFIIPRGRSGGAGALQQATFVSTVPINQVDPTSGKPIVPGITSVYKGYTIGHCCTQSVADWEKLSEAVKDEAVRRYFR
jgi:hypothetical protein